MAPTTYEKFRPASRVRKMFNPCDETAQSVLGRELEITLSAPSPNQVKFQALEPLQRSVPLSCEPASAKFGFVGWAEP